jgi:hypothetical protein
MGKELVELTRFHRSRVYPRSAHDVAPKSAKADLGGEPEVHPGSSPGQAFAGKRFGWVEFS